MSDEQDPTTPTSADNPYEFSLPEEEDEADTRVSDSVDPLQLTLDASTGPQESTSSFFIPILRSSESEISMNVLPQSTRVFKNYPFADPFSHYDYASQELCSYPTNYDEGASTYNNLFPDSNLVHSTTTPENNAFANPLSNGDIHMPNVAATQELLTPVIKEVANERARAQMRQSHIPAVNPNSGYLFDSTSSNSSPLSQISDEEIRKYTSGRRNAIDSRMLSFIQNSSVTEGFQDLAGSNSDQAVGQEAADQAEENIQFPVQVPPVVHNSSPPTSIESETQVKLEYPNALNGQENYIHYSTEIHHYRPAVVTPRFLPIVRMRAGETPSHYPVTPPPDITRKNPNQIQRTQSLVQSIAPKYVDYVPASARKGSSPNEKSSRTVAKSKPPAAVRPSTINESKAFFRLTGKSTIPLAVNLENTGRYLSVAIDYGNYTGIIKKTLTLSPDLVNTHVQARLNPSTANSLYKEGSVSVSSCVHQRVKYIRQIEELQGSVTNVAYRVCSAFSLENPYEPQYLRFEIDRDGQLQVSTKSGICSYCPQVKFYQFKNSSYLSHLTLEHGIYSNQYLVPEPKLFGKYDVSKNGATSVRTPGHIQRLVDAIQCPQCAQVIELGCWSNKANNLLSYFRHFKLVHGEITKTQIAKQRPPIKKRGRGLNIVAPGVSQTSHEPNWT